MLLMMVLYIGCALRSSWATPCGTELGMAQETHPWKNPLLPIHSQRSVWSRRELFTCSKNACLLTLSVRFPYRSEFLLFPAHSCRCSFASTLAVRLPSRCYEPVQPPLMKRVVQSMVPGDAKSSCASRKKQGDCSISALSPLRERLLIAVSVM